MGRVRSAFTLVELLVVMALIGVLVALLVPAVQRVRGAAAATMCQNNLKQIALATLHFHDINGAFPPARIVPRLFATEPAYLSCGGYEPTWLVRILPFVEEQNAYQLWDLSAEYKNHAAPVREHVPSAYYCPARRAVDEAVIPSQPGPTIVLGCGCMFPGLPIASGCVGDYAGNHGDLSPGSSGLPTDFYWGGFGTGVIISSRGICDNGRPVRWYDRIRLIDVTDGSSQTFVVGEMHIRGGKVAKIPDNGPSYDGTYFYNSARVGGPGVPLAQGPEDNVAGMGLFAFGSWHPGVCHFAFADGRVRPISNGISTAILERLCNRSDGQEVSGY